RFCWGVRGSDEGSSACLASHGTASKHFCAPNSARGAAVWGPTDLAVCLHGRVGVLSPSNKGRPQSNLAVGEERWGGTRCVVHRQSAEWWVAGSRFPFSGQVPRLVEGACLTKFTDHLPPSIFLSAPIRLVRVDMVLPICTNLPPTWYPLCLSPRRRRRSPRAISRRRPSASQFQPPPMPQRPTPARPPPTREAQGNTMIAMLPARPPLREIKPPPRACTRAHPAASTRTPDRFPASPALPSWPGGLGIHARGLADRCKRVLLFLDSPPAVATYLPILPLDRRPAVASVCVCGCE
ncbi:hypothetical protein MAPG_09536, partial [Magnaporthiopsis poae ATCC 64411]|uniref:Uncharacterized protein n=1 Tax=Magnaporthiopsis poae (strain ATCC 64411 / 73-15) TaxID=644358 RepID=A0A0C4EA77_MAGP6